MTEKINVSNSMALKSVSYPCERVVAGMLNSNNLKVNFVDFDLRVECKVNANNV